MQLIFWKSFTVCRGWWGQRGQRRQDGDRATLGDLPGSASQECSGCEGSKTPTGPWADQGRVGPFLTHIL